MADRIRFLTDARGSPDGSGRTTLTFSEGDVVGVPEDCPRHLAELFTRPDQPTQRAEWVEDELAGAPEEGGLEEPAETKLAEDDFTPAAWAMAQEHGVSPEELGEPSGARGDYLKSDVEAAMEAR